MSENKSRSSNGRRNPKYKRHHSGFYSGGIPITEQELNDVYIKDKDFYRKHASIDNEKYEPIQKLTDLRFGQVIL